MSMAAPAASQDKVTAPYGSWKSPITADIVSGADKRLGGTAVDGDGRLIWLETRPTESGRGVLVKESETAGDPSPVPITPDYGSKQFVMLMEYLIHDSRESSLNPSTTIVAIDLSDNNIQEPKVLVGGSDFYAFPRVDSKGERIAWIEWSHPNMPWDKAELWVGYISENGDICKRICVAGCDPTLLESPTEPKWSSRGELFFITDRKSGVLESLQMGRMGRSYLGILDVVNSLLSALDIPFTDINNISSGIDCFYIEGASAVHPLSLAKVTLDDHKSEAVGFKIIWSSSADISEYKSYFSLPELIEFPTEVPGQNAYAYFYPPSNPINQASQDEKPPLLLESHGGPTDEAHQSLNLSIQYWTSRGWAFVDVNYGGSTGYGREFRERLLGRWGIVDVNDCCSCAKFLVDSGKVDGKRLCATGGSAGGFTTLAALAFKEIFKAGASLYGVSCLILPQYEIADLSMLRAGMPKFESHYIDNLVGSESAYFERSPINFVDKFSCPIILFQGLEDKVVPPEQARKIYLALKKKGLPVALVQYEGEQHGFRKAENIKFTLEQQMVFFARVVGHFEVADQITPIKIDNFD
ncbi:Dipeptidyl peptidase family member 6 [Vitis vinifera]|uniref:Dipeptidyl peptidase family member 6 n=1 Tax=Vitis vinifera TaxID=29760 RepID=A0A438K233_VITVI|nr:Dipeptidyl peptidase family member 6 [Vitis vinifera]